MEEVLGGRAVTERFATYLANWRSVLDRRIAEAMETFARDEIERVRLAIMPRWAADGLVPPAWTRATSRAIFDSEGLAAGLAGWFTANRFDPAVVRIRLDRTQRELAVAHAAARAPAMPPGH